MDMTAMLSPEQKDILRAVAAGEYRAPDGGAKRRIQRLHQHGLVRRHDTDMMLCFPTDAGMTLARDLGLLDPAGPEPALPASTLAVEFGLVEAPKPAKVPEIVTMLETAARLFDEGDIQRARVIADGAYDLSQAEARFAAKYAATRELVPKFRQLQGDALLMETRCKIQLAKAYDAAQEAGQAAKKGRPKNVATDDIFKQAEAGLTRQEIHDARKLAAAEEKMPGIAERAIAARVAAGLAPTRANLKNAIGTKTATKEERGNNLYETPVLATNVVLALESFTATVNDPFCGKGAIVRVLEAAGYEVILGDIEDYGTTTKDGVVQDIGDFRETESAGYDIVSNPPYGDEMNSCIAHALRVHRPRKMALLLNLNVLAGFEDSDRTFYMEECPPARIYVMKRRLPMMHRDGWDGKIAGSQMNTMWCVWELQEDGTYGSETIIRRVDYADYKPADASEGEAE